MNECSGICDPALSLTSFPQSPKSRETLWGSRNLTVIKLNEIIIRLLLEIVEFLSFPLFLRYLLKMRQPYAFLLKHMLYQPSIVNIKCDSRVIFILRKRVISREFLNEFTVPLDPSIDQLCKLILMPPNEIRLVRLGQELFQERFSLQRPESSHFLDVGICLKSVMELFHGSGRLVVSHHEFCQEHAGVETIFDRLIDQAFVISHDPLNLL